jgi:ubiquinone/menaquinone biosynthesis C-methylase UbiE
LCRELSRDLCRNDARNHPPATGGCSHQSRHHVLEIGSGPGHVAQSLTEAGAIVTGVDFSAEMVAVARRQFPGITFQEADAEQLPFEAGTFDAVVSNLVHHLARPTMVFQEVCRVLKAGGRFAFAVFGAPEAQSSISAFFTAVQAH